ncbi:alpha-2-macroglobulin-like [Pelobates fuscus]|uniref:alpha-2-macroglobulin-like n=1 Tax=Pelobates fuscus TaxID=191477 RepID=UPI002FE45A41
MVPWAFYIGLIFCFCWSSEAKLHYAVIIPSEIQALRSQLVCLHVEGAEGETNITLNLITVDGNTTLIEKDVEQKSLFSCIQFQTPNPKGGNEEVATLDVTIKTPLEIISNKAKVLLKRQRSSLVVQTDKHIYKPGQTVKFRIISLKENLQPGRNMIQVVELQDPGKNRIGQWLNVTLNEGIADLSFPLSEEPTLGDYRIMIEGKVHVFAVLEYVLPKFDVSVELPELVLFNSLTVPVQICGRYTYGKPVQGLYNITVCRERLTGYMTYVQNRISSLCIEKSGKLDKSGCTTRELTSDELALTKTGFHMELKATATITEDGTGVEFTRDSRSTISYVLVKVSFVDAETTYKAGIPYSGVLKVQDGSGSPIPDKQVFLSVDTVLSTEKLTLITDKNGYAVFKLENTTSWRDKISIMAQTTQEDRKNQFGIIDPIYYNGHLQLSPFYSKSKSFLKLHSLEKVLPCEGQQEVQVEYIIKHTELNSESKSLNLHYLLVSKESIWHSGTIELFTKNNGEDLIGTTSLNVPLSANVSPSIRALVYILLPDGEIVADSAKFTVQRCFNNKVSAGFTPEEVLPGFDVSLQIQAAAGSLCGIRVVDQSVVLMKPDLELTADKIHNLFPFRDVGGYDYRIEENEPRCSHYEFPSLSFGRPSFYRRPWEQQSRSYMLPWIPQSEFDVYSLFKDISLKIITSGDIKKPLKCFHNYDFMHYGIPGPPGAQPRLDAVPAGGSVNPAERPLPSKVEIVRKYFPETWVWKLARVGDSGTVNLHVTAPDTITDWYAGAFCMGPNGFGLSSPTTLRTFQPFFVELTLPYSVVLGESFTLKVNVFNYRKECIKIQTTLKESEELDEEPCADCQRTSCLCADESKTFYWNLKATKIGEVNMTVQTEALDTQDLCDNELPIVPSQGSIDTVIKPLLVKPGGVLEEISHSSLLCIQKDEDHSMQEVVLKLPEKIVKESERAYVTVLGDLMGTAMQNLDRLLAMPYGCGEQNMVLFTPNIFILQYMEKTQQLNHEIQNKAKRFLETGYQRQLTYERNDGSYSAFGKSDKEGNTWLTAFVVKSFNKARPYIFVDENHLHNSFLWLKDHRQKNGCFRSVGKLFNNAMKGGVDDEISLSAFVTIALLEFGMSAEDTVVADALSCLREAAVNVSNIYTQALLAYTFTLAGETDLRQHLLEKLDKQAVRKDGQLHWERQSSTPASDQFWYRAPSAEVEVTSYMLLTMLCGSEKDLGRASEIVNWLSKQQNPNGGFASTQDTVVALQALAKYAEATFSDTGDVTVTVRSQTGVMEFHVDNTNRLLLQRMPLPDIPGKYTLTATGSGCVYVQTVLRYNVPPPRHHATFAVNVEVQPDECLEDPMTKLEIHLTAKYIGSREKSNMALIEVKMLSGFIPVKSSVRELEKKKVIQRSEITTDMVTLYLDELGPRSIKLSFTVEQDIEVKNLKPATVKVYDYYETGEYAVTEYNSPCSSDEKTNN